MFVFLRSVNYYYYENLIWIHNKKQIQEPVKLYTFPISRDGELLQDKQRQQKNETVTVQEGQFAAIRTMTASNPFNINTRSFSINYKTIDFLHSKKQNGLLILNDCLNFQIVF